MTPFGFEYGTPPGLIAGGRSSSSFERGATLVIGFGEAGDFLLAGDTRQEVVAPFSLEADVRVAVAAPMPKINSLDYGYMGSFLGRAMAGFELGPYLVINDTFAMPFALDGDTRQVVFNLVGLDGDVLLEVAPLKRELNGLDFGALGLAFGNGRYDAGKFDQGFPPGGVLPWVKTYTRRGASLLTQQRVSEDRSGLLETHQVVFEDKGGALELTAIVFNEVGDFLMIALVNVIWAHVPDGPPTSWGEGGHGKTAWTKGEPGKTSWDGQGTAPKTPWTKATAGKPTAWDGEE